MPNPFDQFDSGPADPGFTGVIPGVPKAPPVPSGYEPDPAKPGAVRPIEGGPSDPSATSDSLDPATVSFYAQQVLSGAPMPPMGMGKQASKMRQEVMKEVARQAGAQGLTGSDLAKQIAHYQSGKKQLGTLETQLGTTRQNEETALLNGQQFIDRSAELPLQTEYPALNFITQTLQKNLPIPGHETKVAMDAAYNTFVNEYAKVVSGSPSGAGVLSDSARHEAMSVLTGNYSLEQKKAVFEQMKTDMANRMTAMKGGINQGYDALVNQPGYDVPEGLSGLPVGQQKQQDHIFIPGVGANGPDGGDGGGSGGDSPPGASDLSPDQKLAYAAFLTANPKPDGSTLKTFLEKLTGKQVTNADDIAKAIAEGRGASTMIQDLTKQAKVATRLDEMKAEGTGATNAAGAGALDAITLGSADEINAFGGAVGGALKGKGSFSDLYDTNVTANRQFEGQLQKEHPWAYTGGELAGGLVLAPLGGELSSSNAVLDLAKAGAKTGAAYGGAYGFNSGTGIGNRAENAVTGIVAGGVTGGALGAGGGAVANRISNNNALRWLAPDVADAAQAEGVGLIRPMVDPASRGKFGALESAPGSQNVIRQGVDRVRGQIEDRAVSLGAGGTALEPGAAGERLKLAGNRYIERSRGIKDRLYRAAENAAGDTRVTPQRAIDQLNADIEQLSANPKTNAATIQFLQDKVADLSTQGGKTVAEIRNIREGLRGEIGSKNLTMTNAERLANNALQAAGEDISASAPEAGRLYRRADSFYRERQTVVDDVKRSILGNKNDPLDPQKTFANIKTLAAPGGNLRRLSAVTRYLEPGERQDIAATVAESLGRDAPDMPFSADKFVSQTNKISPAARRVIFGEGGARSIENLRLLSQKLKEGVGDLNRSKTANSVLRQMARNFIGSITGLGTVGFAAGGTHGAATGAVAGAAAQTIGVGRNILSARAMVNPRLSQWMAQAADVSTPSQAKQAVKGLSLVISREPAIANELTPLRDFLNQRVTQLLAADPNAQDGNNEQP